MLSVKETNKQILHVAIGYPPNQSEPVMILSAPLGVALQPGIEMKIDEGTARRIPFSVCTNKGCQAGMKLDEAALSELRKGNQAEMVFGDLQRHGVKVPVSLKGLTKALEALNKK